MQCVKITTPIKSLIWKSVQVLWLAFIDALGATNVQWFIFIYLESVQFYSENAFFVSFTTNLLNKIDGFERIYNYKVCTIYLVLCKLFKAFIKYRIVPTVVLFCAKDAEAILGLHGADYQTALLHWPHSQ